MDPDRTWNVRFTVTEIQQPHNACGYRQPQDETEVVDQFKHITATQHNQRHQTLQTQSDMW
jgi:hypothetical protein